MDLSYVEGQVVRAIEMIDRAEFEQAKHLRNQAANFDDRVPVRYLMSERAHYLALVGKLYLDEVLIVIRLEKEKTV